MRGFRKLVMLGVLLVTLLLVIDTIDAGRKQGKKKELETGKPYDEEDSKFTNKKKHLESLKQDKLKKSGSQSTENYEEENHFVSRDSKFDSKKSDGKKNFKFASKEKKFTENEKTKTSRHFQKYKKSKVLEEEPAERFDYSKSKGKKGKPQYRSENVDKIVKTVKKSTQKKLVEENENVEKILNDEFEKFKNEDSFSGEEISGGNPKKRKYKLVEVVLQEDGQDEEQEGNETTVGLGSEEQEYTHFESEEKTRSIQNPKFYKNKKSSKKYNIVQEEQDDESASEDSYFNNTEDTLDQELAEDMSEVESFATRYTDPAADSCQRLPEDPSRQGPKKLTLYVVEEEIDGQIKKRVVTEEDGVTMCEVADLLKETYNMNIPDE